MLEPITDPNVDPNQDPNVNKPPEGDNPPAGEEHDANYWSKKFGDSENEKGALREQLETEKANTLFFQQQAQAAQAAPQNQDNGELKLDPMDENFGTNLVKTVRKVFQEESTMNKVTDQINYLVEKHGMTQIAAQNVLNFGYQNGANNPETALKLFSQNFGTQFIQNPNPENNNPNPPPDPNQKPNLAPANNQVRYNVNAPLVPAGGEGGSDTGLEKMPSIDDWNSMTDEQKRAHRQKVKDGKTEFDSTNAVYATPTS